MKTIIKLTVAAALTAGTFHALAQDDALAQLRARRAAELQQAGVQPAQPADAAPAPDNFAPAALPAVDQPVLAAPPDTIAQTTYVPSTATALSTNGITFNFRNAALSDVLTYMSDAAGFTIVLNAPVNGRVTVINRNPMTKDEAVNLLNTVLNQSGLAAVQDDQILTIMTKAEAIHADIQVKVGNDFTNIPKNAVIVTQIIPIRFVDAQQLIVDISPFVSSQAVIVANQAGNSIIITDTQSNIRHLIQIIGSIDSSAEMETAIQVFALKYANPNDVVATLAGVFPSAPGGAQTINVGGRGGGRGGAAGGAGGRGGAGGNTSAARVQKAQQVLAVADGRTQSVVVTAAKDMMPQISDMIARLDIDSSRTPDVSVVKLNNADPYQAAQVLQNLFGGTTARTGSTQTSTLEQRGTTALPTTSSGTTTGGTTRGGGGISF